MKEILRLKDVSKDYGIKGFKTNVLRNISLSVYEGDFIAIMGPSGAGKTTLLNLMSTLDKATSGEIILDGIDIDKVKNKDLSKIRRDKIGFLFQDYNLLDNMTLMNNIALPLALGRKRSKEIEERVVEISKKFGLDKHLDKYPYQLSGGQKQRGAAARSLITNPSVIFADEPTGALDSRSAYELLDSLDRVNKENNATIIMITHDPLTASYSNEVYMISDGNIKCKLSKGENRKEFYGKIMEMLSSMGGGL
ncbi:ABC transporter ATP-binding protein [Clostridioides mangenotii]|uniref:ABC transporter ATP-binding protein n=1 Tax=Metaclostridioides mangenotii TaxID=1540 RepID=UPI001C0F913D|nr:ABC transporter ATP-binding protein [Clostridioides mangenotii]MBU5307484.1 ABC transporter ATP-binding protein [Clostridioides mangenotii]